RNASAPRPRRESRGRQHRGGALLSAYRRRVAAVGHGPFIVLLGENRPTSRRAAVPFGHRRRAIGCSCGWRPPNVIVPPMLPIAACGLTSEILVERVPAVSPMEFERRYRRASQPVVFTDLIPKWKAWRCWSHKYFHNVW